MEVDNKALIYLIKQINRSVDKLIFELNLKDKQIEDLKNRLSDYEVIAEDIADLQSLREENQKLQAQLQKAGVPVVTAATNEAPAGGGAQVKRRRLNVKR